MRVVERTVRDIAPGVYELGLTLMGPARDEFSDEGGSAGGPGLVYAVLSGSSGPYDPAGEKFLLWDRTGDSTLIPARATAGPFEFVASDRSWPPWYGIQITDDGVISATMVASACGVVWSSPTGFLVTWNLLLNGVIVASESIEATVPGFWGVWGPTVSVTDLAVTNGDVLSGQLICADLIDGDPMPMFRSPWGVNPGVKSNRLEITGGTF